MGTRMEVAQLESRMNCEDYRKLQALFLVSVFLVSKFWSLWANLAHVRNTWERRDRYKIISIIELSTSSSSTFVKFSLLIFMQDSSGASRSLSRAEFIHLAWSSVGHGSREDYGLLFDCVVISQERGGLLLDIDTAKGEGKVDWKGLCSFLLLELSEKVKNRRTSSVPCWTPPRAVTCPHRDTIQKVKSSPHSREKKP